MTDTAARDFSATMQLPKTDFPMRANLPEREPGWVSDWLEKDIYGKLRAKRQAEGAPVFIVHLGPPYANGNFHMGHVLTYVLKDFVVRSKFLAGFDSPYVPGWDCHGLPIEWKVEQDELRAKGKSKHDVSRQQLRAWCRDYAAKWVGIQKAEWQRFGALGDWERPYLTMNSANEAGIVRELGKLVRRGLVYRGLKSTQWSWAEETAMAEAEVEYKDVTSTAVYVALPLVGTDESLVIWTTTPWTLPANRAVAVKRDEAYELVEFDGRKLWVAAALREAFAKVLGVPLTGAERRMGGAFEAQKVAHPLFGDGTADGVTGPVVNGFHVTTDAGTGLVHIAPAHGVEDFQIGQEFGLDLTCPVKGDGTYEDTVPALPLTGVPLAGKLIWKAQKEILEELRASGRLLHAADFQHSYPVSWRSKEKLIYRSTEQWFVGMDIPVKGLIAERPDEAVTLREGSLARIFGKDGVHGVQWVPGYGANRIGSMIEGRPDWCISRQRAWGVPITICVDKRTGEMVADDAVWDHIAALVEREGIDAWDNRLGGREAELFPEGWLAAKGATAADFAYATDILDVWFDSGTTHAHVLRADSGPGQRFHRTDGKRPADLYQEGSDQHRGWFHSSMLTSVGAYGDAPYETVVTSGFVVDGEGRKFSKSLKNGVEPRDLLPKYGMDIIRLWVASSDYSEDIRYSPQIMDGTAEVYRKFRNTLRWLLGNLNGFEAADGMAYADMPELEQYLLHRLHAVAKDVRAHFDAYQFHKAYRVLTEFCTVDLSNFYFDVRKDVLYCDAVASVRRRACQTVLEQVFRMLVTHLAPLAPFTSDEAWKSRYGAEASVQLERFAEPDAEWARDERFAQRWAAIMSIRDAVNVTLEAGRAAGEIKASLEADVRVALPAGDLVASNSADDALMADVCGVSAYASHAVPAVDKMRAEAVRHGGHKCPRCWRFYGQLEDSGVCLRCDEAVQTMTTKAA